MLETLKKNTLKYLLSKVYKEDKVVICFFLYCDLSTGSAVKFYVASSYWVILQTD